MLTKKNIKIHVKDGWERKCANKGALRIKGKCRDVTIHFTDTPKLVKYLKSKTGQNWAQIHSDITKKMGPEIAAEAEKMALKGKTFYKQKYSFTVENGILNSTPIHQTKIHQQPKPTIFEAEGFVFIKQNNQAYKYKIVDPKKYVWAPTQNKDEYKFSLETTFYGYTNKTYKLLTNEQNPKWAIIKQPTNWASYRRNQPNKCFIIEPTKRTASKKDINKYKTELAELPNFDENHEIRQFSKKEKPSEIKNKKIQAVFRKIVKNNKLSEKEANKIKTLLPDIEKISEKYPHLLQILSLNAIIAKDIFGRPNNTYQHIQSFIKLFQDTENGHFVLQKTITQIMPGYDTSIFERQIISRQNEPTTAAIPDNRLQLILKRILEQPKKYGEHFQRLIKIQKMYQPKINKS